MPSDPRDSNDYVDYSHLNDTREAVDPPMKRWPYFVLLAGLVLAGWYLFFPSDSNESASATSTTVIKAPPPKKKEGTTTSTSAKKPTSGQVSVKRSAEEAIADWGEFASTGDLNLVKKTFDVDGPQYAQLKKDAAKIKNNPPDNPIVLDLVRSTERDPRGGRAVIEATVVQRREGSDDKTYSWVIELTESKSRWLIWRVQTA